jgi:hypothetical protein
MSQLLTHIQAEELLLLVIYIVLLGYIGSLILRGWAGRSPDKLVFFKHALRCSTEAQCQAIQRGSIWIKRCKQWLVMTSLGTFLFAGDLLSATIQYIEHLEAKSRPSLLWRWSFGWLQDPQRNNKLIEIWKLYDTFESLIFLVFLTIAARWTYADARCRHGRFPNFYVLMSIMLCVNATTYWGLWYVCGDLILELSSKT